MVGNPLNQEESYIDNPLGIHWYLQSNIRMQGMNVQRNQVNGDLYMSVQVTGAVGPAAYGDTQQNNPFRQGRTGELMFTELHGRYYEQSVRGQIFTAANPATQAVSVALATAYTGLCLSNTAGSGKNLVLLQAGWAITAAPAGIVSVGLMGGFGAVTHTAALIVNSSLINSAMTGTVNSAGKVDSSATIPTPVYLAPMLNGNTSGALPTASMNVMTAQEGIWVIPPGGFIAIYCLTAGTGNGFMAWEEVVI